MRLSSLNPGLALLVAVVLSLASPVSAQTVDVIEYYNAGQDHYFVSSLQPDVAALDSGKFKGWVRTGWVFPAYGQPTGNASPVCRFYIPPAVGDSHFYSASPAECAQTAARFPSFIEESPSVMYIDLPDPTTGACPASDIPVYRVWDNRVDSNHRYTTDPAVRAAMVAKGWIAEGYGPNQVIMCAPKPPVPMPSGLYVLNEAANLQSVVTAYAPGLAATPAYAGDVAGHAIFVPIAKILPSVSAWGEFSWDWTYVDALVQTALVNGKKFSIELETGFQSGATYAQSLPPGFAALCGANCAPLFDVWVVGGSGGRCASAYILLPWVANVQQFWRAAAFALSAHLRQAGTYGSLTLVHVPGLSVYDEEIRLPTGLPAPPATDTSICPDGRPAYPTAINDAVASRWQGLGYSDAAVINGIQAVATAFAQAFPDRMLGLSLFNPGPNGIDFPNLTGDPAGYVAGQIVQAVNGIAPGRVQLQSDNLDSNFVQAQVTTLASQYGDRVGWQTNKHAESGAGCNGGGVGSCNPDGPTGPFFQLLKAGAVNRAAYIEIWSADVIAYPQSLDAARAAGYYPG